MKTSELIGAELDLYVWRIECTDYKKFRQSKPHDFSPSTNWQQGGPLIEKYKIIIDCYLPENLWQSCLAVGAEKYRFSQKWQKGETPPNSRHEIYCSF